MSYEISNINHKPVVNVTYSHTDSIGYSHGHPGTWQLSIMWILGICIIAANIPVFVVLPRLSRLQRSMCYTMYCLAITDLLLGIESVVHLIFLAVTESYTVCGSMCHWNCFVNSVLDSTSIIALSCISLDKCLTLRYPLHYKVFMTRTKIVLILSSIWAAMSLLYMPLLFGESMNVGVKLYTGAFLASFNFTRNWTYTTIVMICVQALPSAVIVTSFLLICQTIRQQKRKHLTLKCGQERQSERNSDIKIIRTLFVMSSGFYIMWTPLFVTVIYWELFTGHTLHPISDFLCFCLGGANSILNPFLYILTLDSYRRMLYRMVGINKRSSVAMEADSTGNSKLRYSMGNYYSATQL